MLKLEQDEFEAAMKASMLVEEERKNEMDEEEQMFKMVMEASLKEEEARVKKIKERDNEEEKEIL